MKIALAQINTVIGDFDGNAAKILKAYQRGSDAGVDLVICPELAITGYPPRDLLTKKGFIRRNLEVLDRLAETAGPVGLLVGYVDDNRDRPGRDATNSAALLQEGRIIAQRTKSLLPTYDVFDEDRYFEPARENAPVDFNGNRVGLTICEDLWNDEDFWRERRYRQNPATALTAAGARILFNLSASPWHLGKNRLRFGMLGSLAAKTACPLVYCNLVGANDELVFDGGSLVFNGQGKLIARGKLFDEDFVVVDTDSEEELKPEDCPDEEKLFRALQLGLHDYFEKCGFSSAVIGLSGGIDSAVTACLAVASLGRDNVRGVALPSQYSSTGSVEDARRLAQNLDIQFDVVPIKEPFLAVMNQMKDVFSGLPEDITEENVQARLRGLILMAFTNKFGSLLLSTGNKSELAVGYCTLYGDMNGGFALLNDVPKTMVYRLARWINRNKELIPENTITKAPSAELRPGQTDQDSLPAYEILDYVLESYIEKGMPPGEITDHGVDQETVWKLVRMIDKNEYKRRQAAPGLKVTSKAFGMGRRMPIAQHFTTK